MTPIEQIRQALEAEYGRCLDNRAFKIGSTMILEVDGVSVEHALDEIEDDIATFTMTIRFLPTRAD